MASLFNTYLFSTIVITQYSTINDDNRWLVAGHKSLAGKGAGGANAPIKFLEPKFNQARAKRGWVELTSPNWKVSFVCSGLRIPVSCTCKYMYVYT
jgi:hypothetical protein